MTLSNRNKIVHKQIFHLLWILKLWVNIEKAMILTGGSNISYIRFQAPSRNFHSPPHVNRTLKKSPSYLDPNCPHKFSSLQSHKLLLFTRFFSSQGPHHTGITCSTSALFSWRQPLFSVSSPTPSNLFFSQQEDCLELPQQHGITTFSLDNTIFCLYCNFFNFFLLYSISGYKIKYKLLLNM